jgi:hypothetical protein
MNSCCPLTTNAIALATVLKKRVIQKRTKGKMDLPPNAVLMCCEKQILRKDADNKKQIMQNKRLSPKHKWISERPV